MSVLRAILGRFARFLVRIARRLDPAITPAAAWTMTERMTALRQRYPGAPDHWLELIARRATFDAGPPLAPDDPPRPYSNAPHFPAPDSPHSDRAADAPQQRSTARARQLFFRRFDRRARPAVEATVVNRREREVASLPLADSRPDRPSVTFAPRRLPDPLARLLKLDRRKPRLDLLHFEIPDERHHATDPLLPEHQVVRDDERPMFPDRAAHAPPRPAWAEPIDPAPRSSVDPRWPVLMRASTEPAWPDQPGRSQPDQRFTVTDPRWPNLPAIPDDRDTPLLSARDEAALRSEQLGGTWSA